jgi:glycosyltransferase involved in cell wall biosynthesis
MSTREAIRARELRRCDEVTVLARQVLAFCDDVEATQIWIVLEGQTLIRLAHALVEAGRYRVRVQVMDPPGWQLRAAKVDPDTVGEILDLFDDVVSRAAACATASWNMASIYRQRYGVATTPVVPALAASLACPPGRLTSSPTLKVGFAGQPYARDEVNALLVALAMLQKERPFDRVTLHTFSKWPIEPPADLRVQIVPHAWTSQDKLIPALSTMDLLYCPYWFDPTYREETLLCFPSKITSYLAAGRPVLFHGRHDASPALFLRSGGAGFFCFRPDADSLCHAIRMAMSDSDMYSEKARNGHLLFQRYLTEEQLADSIRAFLAS